MGCVSERPKKHDNRSDRAKHTETWAPKSQMFHLCHGFLFLWGIKYTVNIIAGNMSMHWKKKEEEKKNVPVRMP